MSPVTEAGLTALRELRRNLRSTKGIAMFVLFFLGGTIPSVGQVLLTRIVDTTTMGEAPLEARQQMFEGVLTQLKYDEATAKHLSTCPPPLFLFLFKGALFFLPALILLVGFDQIAGEIQHRSIRYLAGRARRSAIVAGKALGVWGVIATMTMVLSATVWTVMLIRGGYPASLVFSWGFRIWIFTVASAAAYVGLTALVSSLFRTPIVALFVGVAALFGLWLTSSVLGALSFDATQAATWAFPSTYESRLLVSPDPLRVVGGVAALIAWGAVMVAGAAAIVSRRDI
jgi:ABC-type transport system involved in multi-copper enzyme maturation permease subunit